MLLLEPLPLVGLQLSTLRNRWSDLALVRDILHDDGDILEPALGRERPAFLVVVAREVKVTRELDRLWLPRNFHVDRKLAARVLKTWHEDFVDEDTGEVISIERNEIIIDRDTLLQKEHIEIARAVAKAISQIYPNAMEFCHD